MKYVTDEAGQVHGFPDEATEDQILLAMTPQVPPGLGRTFAQAGSNIAKGVAQVVGLPGTISDLASAGLDKVVGAGERALGVDLGPVPQASPWSGNALVRAVNAGGRLAGAEQGLIDRPDLVPQGPGERLAAGAYTGLGMGGGAGAGGGLATEGAHELGWKGPWVDAAAGVLGGGVAGGLEALAARGGNALSGIMSREGQAYQNLGLTPRLAGNESGPDSLRALQRFAVKNSDATRDAAAGQTEDWGNAVERVAGRLDPALPSGARVQITTPQQAGDFVQNVARNWLYNAGDAKSMPAQLDALWSPVNAKLAGQTGDLTGLETTLDRLRGGVGKLQGMADVVNPEEIGALQRELAKVAGPGLQQVPGTPVLIGAPKNLAVPTEDIQALRTVVGRVMGTPGIADSIGKDNLSAVYGALTKSLREVAERQGIGQEFDQANAASVKLFMLRDNLLDKVISTQNPAKETKAAGDVAGRLLRSGKAGDELLGGLRNEPGLEPAANALGAFALRDASRATPAGQGAASETLDPRRFVKELALNKLSPEAQDALFGPVGGHVGDLKVVGQDIAPTGKALARAEGNPGGPAQHLTGAGVGGLAGGLLAHHLGLDPLVAEGLGGAVGMAVPGVSGAGAGAIVRNPWLARSVLGQAPQGGVPNALLGAMGGYATGR